MGAATSLFASLASLFVGTSPVEAAHASRPADRGTFLLVDRSLSQRRCDRFGVEGDQLLVWLVDEGGAGSADRKAGPERIPMAQCLAILRAASAAESGTAVLLQSDGQRFPGEPHVRDAHGVRNFLWRHRRLGELRVAIESLRSLILVPNTIAPGAEANDIVVLANGDRIEGLVSELGATVAIERVPSGRSTTAGSSGASKEESANVGSAATGVAETARDGADDGPSEVPLARIAAISFITPIEPPRGQRVWCTDGTVVTATPNFDADTGLLQLRRHTTPTGLAAGGTRDGAGEATVVPILPPEEILGYVPELGAITPLAAVRPLEARGAGEMPRRHVSPPELAPGIWPAGATPIRFQGPAIYRYRLPAKGCSLVGTIVAYQPDEAWTDFEVVLRDGDKEVLRRRVSATSEPIVLAQPLTSDEITIEITEGEHGPVRDVAEFRQAILVLPERGGAAATR